MGLDPRVWGRTLGHLTKDAGAVETHTLGAALCMATSMQVGYLRHLAMLQADGHVKAVLEAAASDVLAGVPLRWMDEEAWLFSQRHRPTPSPVPIPDPPTTHMMPEAQCIVCGATVREGERHEHGHY